jgi:hypothetical protein
MPVPKSVTKISRDGNVTYTQSVDRVNYTIRELTRAALRDVGKYVCKQFRTSYYARFKRHSGRVGRFTQYWVKHKQKDIELQVGVKPNGFYGGFQELGSSKTPRLGLLTHAVQDNIPMIIEIESQYLSALEDEATALSLISEEDYEGGADE